VAFLWFGNHPTPLTWLPCDFWLFPKLEMALKGKRFDDDTFEENMTSYVISIPKDSSKRCFQQLLICWYKCKASEGEYFEED